MSSSGPSGVRSSLRNIGRDLLGTRRFVLADQERFAGLSGDFNPLHLNPTTTHRAMFGAIAPYTTARVEQLEARSGLRTHVRVLESGSPGRTRLLRSVAFSSGRRNDQGIIP